MRFEVSVNENVCFSCQHRDVLSALCFRDGGEGGGDRNKVARIARAKEGAE